MKLRIYLSEWFFNMGLIGFNRILEYNEKFCRLELKKYNYLYKDNYVEFDKDILENFHNYYFNYFLNRYDVCKDQSERLDRYLNICKKGEKFKDYLKYIKETVKANNNKIKKIDEKIYFNVDNIYKKLSNIKNIEQIDELEELIKYYKEILSIKPVNERTTLNKFKAVLSGSFYGQVSFLNVVNTNKTIEEQKQIMFKDYIQPILYSNDLNNHINNNDFESVQKYITLKLDSESINKNIEKFFKDINRKFIKKNKDIHNIKNYVEEYLTCSLCGEQKSIGNNYGEGDFVPLAVSADNTRNMFWNFNTNYPICDMCKLVLFCAAAGTVDIYKTYMDSNLDPKNKLYYAFVNMDTSIEELKKNNEIFNQKRGHDNAFKELIFDIVTSTKQRSIWELENILYVEFNADYSSKNSKVNYFNIPKYKALFFRDRINLVNSIKESSFKSEVLDNIINNKDLKFVIDKKLREIIKNNYFSSLDCYRATEIRYYLNVYKGGENESMLSKVDDKRLKFIYMRGLELGKDYRDKNEGNKVDSIAYRLLNSSKANNKKEFMDTLIRVLMSRGKDVPSIFLNVMTEKDLAFEEIASAFISGLVSKNYFKNEDKGDK